MLAQYAVLSPWHQLTSSVALPDFIMIIMQNVHDVTMTGFFLLSDIYNNYMHAC